MRGRSWAGMEEGDVFRRPDHTQGCSAFEADPDKPAMCIFCLHGSSCNRVGLAGYRYCKRFTANACVFDLPILERRSIPHYCVLPGKSRTFSGMLVQIPRKLRCRQGLRIGATEMPEYQCCKQEASRTGGHCVQWLVFLPLPRLPMRKI